jgi:trans-aconitate methyltransferase
MKLARIDPAVLAEAAAVPTDAYRIPTMYFYPNPIVRWFAWARLARVCRLIAPVARPDMRVLDFCGGGGVFLPTLARYFRHVELIDLYADAAARLAARLGISNVTITRADAMAHRYPHAYDLVLALDVLEHFRDLGRVVELLAGPLVADGGHLVVSVPAETGFYDFMRTRVLGIERPWDHYHRGAEILDALRRAGPFQLERVHYLPPVVGRLVPIFMIARFRKAEARPAS